MKLRLISGKFGGRFIGSPDNKGITHPMNERVRISLFNILGDKLRGANVLDAFAGTGSLGLESISRGSSRVTFIENNAKALDVLRNNIKALEIDEITEVIPTTIEKWYKNNNSLRYDVIFTDSPYNEPQLSTVSRLSELLTTSGIMIVSYSGRGEVPQLDKVVVVDNRSYGEAALAFYQKK